MIQLGYLDLDIHDCHGGRRGIGDEWPEGNPELTGEMHQWRRHHPAVIALHGIATSVTNQSAGRSIRAKERRKYYCECQDPPTTFHADLLTQGAFESYGEN